jgi:hypothetical protein
LYGKRTVTVKLVVPTTCQSAMPQSFKRGFVAAYGFARGAKSVRLRQTQRRFMAHATGLKALLSLAVYVAHWQGRLTVTVFCQSRY